MDSATFLCAACGLPLTASLTPLEDTALLSEKDGEDHVPAGSFWIPGSPDEDGGYYTEAGGCILVNLRDVRNTKPYPDSRRRQGCCGLDGCDGINAVCLNGHEVGTERSDCWLAHSMAFDPSLVKRSGG